jgi:hypothetical protein
MQELNQKLSEAKGLYQDLVSLGCERMEYGI